MGRRPPHPREVRERAVTMVFEHRGEYASQWAAITSIAAKFGMTAETLRSWVRQAEVDDGTRPAITTASTTTSRPRARLARAQSRTDHLASTAVTQTREQLARLQTDLATAQAHRTELSH